MITIEYLHYEPITDRPNSEHAGDIKRKETSNTFAKHLKVLP